MISPPNLKVVGAGVALLVLATVGNLLLTAATLQADVHAGVPVSQTGGASDMTLLLDGSRAFIHGQPAQPLYGTRIPMSYAPPFAVLFAPLALLTAGQATAVSAILAVVCVACAMAVWAYSARGFPGFLVPVMLSLPAVQILNLGQLQSGLGLLALTIAIFAQRRERWLVVGAGLAVASLRISNTLPVAVMIAVGLWGRPKAMARTAVGAAMVLLPLITMAFAWDHTWPADYLTTLSYERLYGPVGIVQIYLGNRGALAFTGLDGLFCALLVWRDRGGPLNLDRTAVGMASTVLTAMLAGWYCAIFAMPALIRTAGRPGKAAIIWAAAMLPWLAVLASAPWLLSRDPELTGNVLATLGPVVIAGSAFALLRPPDSADRSTSSHERPRLPS